MAINYLRQIWKKKDKSKLKETGLTQNEEQPQIMESCTTKEEPQYEILEREIVPSTIICPDCGGLTLEGLEFCDKCGGELISRD